MAKENTAVAEGQIADFSPQQQYIDRARELIAARSNDSVPLAYVHSYGCQQNVSDGEKLKGILADIGYGFTDGPENAELVIYNTCAVREHAEDRVFGNVGALKNHKRRNPNMLIGLCGCMMQQEHVVERIKKNYPFVNLVFGTFALHRLPQILCEEYEKGGRVFDTAQEKGTITEGIPLRRDGEIKAWLPIMYGCDNFCSYCVVPFVRGRERSRRVEDVVEEAKRIVDAGYKEITLLGQNVNSYGKGLEGDVNFSALLRKINAIDGDFRIRFMTSHPKDASFQLIDTMAECEKVCSQLHLPVQSGNDRILKLMNRHYDREKYLALIEYARKKMPDIGLSSDIIVGFPGETYEEFCDTLHLIQKVRYNNLYTFLYSKRKGTAAEKMEDIVPAADKSKWFRELLKVQEEISSQKNKALIGSTLRVLVDGIGKTGDGYVSGRSEDNTIVEFQGDKTLIGTFADATVISAKNWAVLAEKTGKEDTK